MLKRIFPFIDWFKGYRLSLLRADVLAGLTVALVLIPQSMAYAQLAGLPSYYGLYASFLPPIIASLFGSSRQLASGPVAVVSLMSAASLEPIASVGTEGYIAYAILLALMVGIFQLALGILRLGLVVNFISHPVVNGFTNAAAIIIATTQLSKIFGVYVETGNHHYETVLNVIESALDYTHLPTLFLGILAFVIMLGMGKTFPKIPSVLAAVVVTTVISWSIGFEHKKEVPITLIQSTLVRETIHNFNNELKQIDMFSEKRLEASESAAKAEEEKDNLALLEAKGTLDRIELGIAQHKYQAGVIRERLRELHFKVVKGPDDENVFYLKKGIPRGMESGRRIWRIEINNSVLSLERLVMNGGGEVIGSIPKGLPKLNIPHIDLKVMAHLFPFVIIISLLGFMEAIAVAKAMSAKTGQRLDPNQELIGQGMGNIIGALGNSYPTSGSFSRSALNLQTGAVSGLSSIFTGLTVLIMLVFFTQLLYHLPQSVLAAVIMMAVIRLLNVSGFVHAWKSQWYDGVISIISFFCTLVFAPHLEKGIIIGVVLSLLVFLYKSMRPNVSSLSMSTDNTLHDCNAYGLMECEYIAVIRFDGPLFFANASYLEDQVNKRRRTMKNLRHIHIVCDGINDMDASGEEVLSLIVERVRSAGMDISFSGIHGPVIGVLSRTHLLEMIGLDHIYPTMEKAINEVHSETHKDVEEEECPLLTVCRVS